MTDEPIMLESETLAAECKFTVESRRDGDFERNLGGPYVRVTFDGFATNDVLESLSHAIRMVVDK